jgi:hypothetical protein
MDLRIPNVQWEYWAGHGLASGIVQCLSEDKTDRIDPWKRPAPEAQTVILILLKSL